MVEGYGGEQPHMRRDFAGAPISRLNNGVTETTSVAIMKLFKRIDQDLAATLITVGSLTLTILWEILKH